MFARENRFSLWRDRLDLGAEAAARAFYESVDALSPEERRAAMAYLPSLEELEKAFAKAAAHPGPSPLSGVPYLLKDLFDVAGLPTGAGSTFLSEERGLSEKSSALQTTLQAHGGVFAGKTHLHEFAYGLEGTNPHFGDCPHPNFPARLSGGSSSGSAFAVGKGLVPIAFGTDTGGSIRVPASWCGIYGLRLNPGPWARVGCFPLARFYDTAGWFTSTAGDMRSAIRALLHLDPEGKKRSGLYVEDIGVELDPILRDRYREAVAALGAVSDGPAPELMKRFFQHVELGYLILTSRAAVTEHRRWIDDREDQYDPIVRERLLRGRHWERDDIVHATRIQEQIRDTFAEVFIEYDYVVLPAVHTPAPRRDEINARLRQSLLRLNGPASLARLPVLTVPVPLSNGLCGGLQIIYKHVTSRTPLTVLARLERTGWLVE